MLPNKTPCLDETTQRLTELAVASGLRPANMRFELVAPPVLQALGACLYPVRYAHWSIGKAYNHLRAACETGFLRLYEQVLNSDPCYVFLAKNNSTVENAVIVAHALAHSDFFTHNRFCQIPSLTLSYLGHAVQRIHNYETWHGYLAVENILTACLALQPHVNPNCDIEKGGVVPLGCTDLLLFLAMNCPRLAAWEQDVLTIARDEMLYLQGQAATKITNEGWACYWHTRLLHDLPLDTPTRLEFARLQASLLRSEPLRFSPYNIGMQLFASMPFDAIFQVRCDTNDRILLQNHLTASILLELAPMLPPGLGAQLAIDNECDAWDEISRAIGIPSVPIIMVIDDNYRNCGELFLRHEHKGHDLDIRLASGTLNLIALLWRKAVYLETWVRKQRVLLCAPE